MIADCILLNFTKHKDFYEGIKIHDYEKDDLNFNVRVWIRQWLLFTKKTGVQRDENCT